MIDKNAVIDSRAKIAANVSVGPFSIIGCDVEIGEGSQIGPHVVITGPSKMGKNNKILQFASIGSAPQDLKYQDEPTVLEIGDNNVIRECCTLNRGTVHGGNVTRIGSNNLLMAYVHVAHDCKIGNGNVFANNATLAGHVVVENDVLFGGFAAVAQNCTIGSYSFVAGKTSVAKDIPPYILVSGYHGGEATAYGLNVVGLRRRGFARNTIQNLRRAYRLIYKEDLTVKQVIPRLEEMVVECPEVQLFIDALNNSKRGILR